MSYLHHPRIWRCVEQLRSGGMIAYPTEAVWGLGCDPFNSHAVNRILEFKRRPWQKGLILVAASTRQIGFLLGGLTDEQHRLLEESWPGPNTWLLRHRGLIPDLVSGEHDSVAVRVSAHPVVAALCEKFGGPIVSTSANRAGMNPARSGVRARRMLLGDDVEFAPGRVGNRASPSVIRDLTSGRVIRA